LGSANEAFQKIAKAFDVLGDEKKRRCYDLYGLEYFEQQSGGRRKSSDNSSNHNYRHRANNCCDNSDDLTTDELFNIIFGEYFTSSHSSAHRF